MKKVKKLENKRKHETRVSDGRIIQKEVEKDAKKAKVVFFQITD